MAGFGAAVGLQGKAGRVSAAGVMVGAPATWTCQHTGTGVYLITHNLQLDPLKYVVLAHCAANPNITTGPPPSVYAFIYAQTANSFTVTTSQTPPGVPGPMDQSFNFLLCLAGG